MRLAIAAVFFCIAARVTADEPALKSFDERLDAYVKLRKNAAEGIPALKKNATPADIQAHEVALAASIKKARAGAQPGEILGADVKALIDRALKGTLKGTKNTKLRASIKEGNPKHELAAGEVQPVVAVNAVYPTNAPLSTVPPSVLLSLPKLPKDLEYRFVGRTLILRDREANLIVDFIKEAAPPA
jgi:hypothetical protein